MVLIDEIDKAEADLPNGLLEVLGRGSSPPWGGTNRSRSQESSPWSSSPPTRSAFLPNAFIRRCLVLHLKLPEDDKVLRDYLVTRAQVHFPRAVEVEKSAELFRSAAELLVKDRRAAIDRHVTPLPGQAEYLDLILRGARPGARLAGRPVEAARNRGGLCAAEARRDSLMKSVLLGRADLVRALRSGGPELQEAVAHFLGLERIGAAAAGGAGLCPVGDPVPLRSDSRGRRGACGPLPSRCRSGKPNGFSPSSLVSPFPSRPSRTRAHRSPTAPAWSSTRWRRARPALTRLRRASAFTGVGEPDLDRIVERLGRAELLHRLPLRPRKRWGLALQIIVDRSRRLVPYWTDQDLVAGNLQRVYPRDRLQIAVLPEGAGEPWVNLPRRESGAYRMPEPERTWWCWATWAAWLATRERPRRTGWSGAAGSATTATSPWPSSLAIPIAVRRP